MDTFLQQVINGLTAGSVYAVVALGYTMVYGIIQLINFAHGEVVMIGAMVAFTVINALAPTGLPPLVIVLAGTACAIPICMLVGYGMERLACYLQGVDHIMDLNFNGRDGKDRVTYGDVFFQAEQEYSRHNFEYSDTAMLFEQFRMAEDACRNYLDAGWKDGKRERHLMALPAYDQCIKASHVFNLLDARGVISVTERQSYIMRVRELAKACGEAWMKTEAGGAP